MRGMINIRDLPYDLLTDIFLRLPVKSVLRFESVCKPWRSLLTDNQFINLHFHKSSLRNPNLFIRTFFTQNLETLTLNSDFIEEPVNLMLYKLPKVEILGSSHGLICLSDYDATDIYLFNPSTRELVQIPSPPIGYYDTIFYKPSMGFGYDPVLDKYKVVTAVINQDESKQARVYTLGTESWRLLKDAPLFLFFSRAADLHTAQVDSVLHWTAIDLERHRKNGIIVSFNLTKEKFGVIGCPDFNSDDYSIGVWEGCLAAFPHYKEPVVDIWVLKEYVLEESWTKIISIEQFPMGGFYERLRPLVLMKSGDIVIQKTCQGIVLYDPGNRRATILLDHEGFFKVSAHFLMWSLLLQFHHSWPGLKLKGIDMQENPSEKRSGDSIGSVLSEEDCKVDDRYPKQ